MIKLITLTALISVASSSVALAQKSDPCVVLFEGEQITRIRYDPPLKPYAFFDSGTFFNKKQTFIATLYFPTNLSREQMDSLVQKNAKKIKGLCAS